MRAQRAWGPVFVALPAVAAVWLLLRLGTWGPMALIGAAVLLAALSILGRTRAGTSSAPIGLVSGALLCAGIPATLVALTSEGTSRPWMAPLALSVLVGLRLAWIIGDGTQRLVESMVYVFVYVFFGLAPLVQMRTGVDPETTPNIDHSLDPVAMTIVGVGVLAFAVGLALGRVQPSAARHADYSP